MYRQSEGTDHCEKQKKKQQKAAIHTYKYTLLVVNRYEVVQYAHVCFHAGSNVLVCYRVALHETQHTIVLIQ